MTRYLLAAATVAGAFSLAHPAAAACDFDYCVKRPVCTLASVVVDCDDPVPVQPQCFDVYDMRFCI